MGRWQYRSVAYGPYTVVRGQHGWFPTICCSFDVVTAMQTFDTKPEETRPYISFQPGQRILVVEKRYDCGWWMGAVIEDEQSGNLGPKGYFPSKYCQEAVPTQQQVVGGKMGLSGATDQWRKGEQVYVIRIVQRTASGSPRPGGSRCKARVRSPDDSMSAPGRWATRRGSRAPRVA